MYWTTTTARPGCGFGAAGRWLRDEFRTARPVFVFFLAGFLLMLWIVKLALAQYSIEVSTLGRAVIGAAIAAKVVLILDETPLARGFERYPRILAVLAKTFAYGVVFILLGIAERIIDVHRRLGGFGAAARAVLPQMGLHRLLALALGVSLVFAAYFVLSEIGDRMGRGALWALFFERPASAGAAKPDA